MDEEIIIKIMTKNPTPSPPPEERPRRKKSFPSLRPQRPHSSPDHDPPKEVASDSDDDEDDTSNQKQKDDGKPPPSVQIAQKKKIVVAFRFKPSKADLEVLDEMENPKASTSGPLLREMERHRRARLALKLKSKSTNTARTSGSSPIKIPFVKRSCRPKRRIFPSSRASASTSPVKRGQEVAETEETKILKTRDKNKNKESQEDEVEEPLQPQPPDDEVEIIKVITTSKLDVVEEPMCATPPIPNVMPLSKDCSMDMDRKRVIKIKLQRLEEQLIGATDLVTSGSTVDAAAARWDVPASYLAQVLKRNGDKCGIAMLSYLKEQRGVKKRKLSDSTEVEEENLSEKVSGTPDQPSLGPVANKDSRMQKALDLYMSGGISIKAAASRCGISYYCLKNLLRRKGVKVTRARVITVDKKGDVNLSHSSYHGIVDTNAILNPSMLGKLVSYQDRANLLEKALGLLASQRISVEGAAAHYGISYKTLKEYIRRRQKGQTVQILRDRQIGIENQGAQCLSQIDEIEIPTPILDPPCPEQGKGQKSNGTSDPPDEHSHYEIEDGLGTPYSENMWRRSAHTDDVDEMPEHPSSNVGLKENGNDDSFTLSDVKVKNEKQSSERLKETCEASQLSNWILSPIKIEVEPLQQNGNGEGVESKKTYSQIRRNRRKNGKYNPENWVR